jgi:23S rRNA pseudouridine955/2504/2580 synthase
VSSRRRKFPNPDEWIQFEDDDYVVINKPAFISTLEDRKDPDNVLSIFQQKFDEVYVCHRLDKETSGALLLAKNQDAYRHASLQFEERTVEKVYHALVKGRFIEDVIKVDMPLKVAGSGNVRIDKREGKQAETLFRTKQSLGHYSLIEAKPITGRRHQIRVHLAYLEFPICGDSQYGGQPVFLSQFKKNYRPAKDREERPLFDRVALHAYSLKFLDMAGKEVNVSSDHPEDLQMIIRKLEKFG